MIPSEEPRQRWRWSWLRRKKPARQAVAPLTALTPTVPRPSPTTEEPAQAIAPEAGPNAPPQAEPVTAGPETAVEPPKPKRKRRRGSKGHKGRGKAVAPSTGDPSEPSAVSPDADPSPAPQKSRPDVRETESVTFESLGISGSVLKAIHRMGFKSPTPIQERTIPLAVAGRDVLGQSQTGSGKTCAFAVPILQGLGPPGGVQALVVTPTRELAMQVADEMAELARYTPARLLAAFGGGPIDMQILALHNGVDIIVGTPGRLLDLIYRGELDFGDLHFLVLDEADEMLNMGFLEDIERIVSCLPEERRTLLFSATLPEEIRRIAERFMRDPVFVQVKNTQETLPAINQVFVDIQGMSRTEALRRVLADPAVKRAIVFCRTKIRAGRLAGELARTEPKVAALHGDMSQAERTRVMNQFRRGQLRVLVATDVASRGIDVDDVTHVINYDCPNDLDSYVHRVGRTARAGKSGTALTLVDVQDRKAVKAIQRYTAGVKEVAGGVAPGEGESASERNPDRGAGKPQNGAVAEAEAAATVETVEESAPKKKARRRRRRAGSGRKNPGVAGVGQEAGAEPR